MKSDRSRSSDCQFAERLLEKWLNADVQSTIVSSISLVVEPTKK